MKRKAQNQNCVVSCSENNNFSSLMHRWWLSFGYQCAMFIVKRSYKRGISQEPELSIGNYIFHPEGFSHLFSHVSLMISL